MRARVQLLRHGGEVGRFTGDLEEYGSFGHRVDIDVCRFEACRERISEMPTVFGNLCRLLQFPVRAERDEQKLCGDTS